VTHGGGGHTGGGDGVRRSCAAGAVHAAAATAAGCARDPGMEGRTAFGMVTHDKRAQD